MVVNGTVVVVAKCPIPGKSKTRLIPLLGEQGAATLAQAMLTDILKNLTTLKHSLTSRNAQIHLMLLYAPREGRVIMESLLAQLDLSDDWHLEPMLDGDLQSSDLGAKLTHALVRARERQQQAGWNGPVVFLGMDSPETPMDELEGVFTAAPSASAALLCPAQDGGYGLLAVPPCTPADRVFRGVRWSQSLTAVSQIKALTDAGVTVRLGRMMYDVDEPEDVQALVQRLLSSSRSRTPATSNTATSNSDHKEDKAKSLDVLVQSSANPGREHTSTCPQTKAILHIMDLLLSPNSSPT